MNGHERELLQGGGTMYYRYHPQQRAVRLHAGLSSARHFSQSFVSLIASCNICNCSNVSSFASRWAVLGSPCDRSIQNSAKNQSRLLFIYYSSVFISLSLSLFCLHLVLLIPFQSFLFLLLPPPSLSFVLTSSSLLRMTISLLSLQLSSRLFAPERSFFDNALEISLCRRAVSYLYPKNCLRYHVEVRKRHRSHRRGQHPRHSTTCAGPSSASFRQRDLVSSDRYNF